MTALFVVLSLSQQPNWLADYHDRPACAAAAEAFRKPLVANVHSDAIPVAAFCVPIEEKEQAE